MFRKCCLISSHCRYLQTDEYEWPSTCVLNKDVSRIGFTPKFLKKGYKMIQYCVKNGRRCKTHHNCCSRRCIRSVCHPQKKGKCIEDEAECTHERQCCSIVCKRQKVGYHYQNTKTCRHVPHYGKCKTSQLHCKYHVQCCSKNCTSVSNGRKKYCIHNKGLAITKMGQYAYLVLASYFLFLSTFCRGRGRRMF